jgi:hypothetical protein
MWYVVFAFLSVGFVALFVAPLLLPKARTKRTSVLTGMSGTFPILQAFVDQDARADAGLDELRELGAEVKRIQGGGVGGSEEPTISRATPQAGTRVANPKNHQTGKEAAIAAVPMLDPIGSPSEEPTIQVSRRDVAASIEQPAGRKQPKIPGPAAPVLRRLQGVRSADYKSPEPVVGDEDSTLVRSATKLRMPMIDELDEPTNVLPDRNSILQRASEAVGPNDPTQLRDAHEDLRETVAQPVDPAGPDATTNVKIKN